MRQAMFILRTILDVPRRLLRRAYDWTVHWADTSQGLVALFLISLAESSFFPVPPDVLLIAIVAANPTRWLTAATTCTGGSLIGASVGYVIGFGLMTTVGQPIIDFYGATHHWDRFLLLAETWGVSFLMAAAFTPIPFKVATIASGATEMPFVPFLIVSLVGRSARFFLVAGLMRLFGASIRRALEANFDRAALLFLALLVGGFVVLRYF